MAIEKKDKNASNLEKNGVKSKFEKFYKSSFNLKNQTNANLNQKSGASLG